MTPDEVRFSWLVPVGPATEPTQLEQCLASIVREMRHGDELILVRDNEPQQYRCLYHWVDGFGPMTKADMQGRPWPLEVDRNPQVVTIDAGPDCRDCGKALNAGLIRAKNPYIIRQDADDYDLPGRRAFHLRQILMRPDAAAWGGGIRHCQHIGYETPRQARAPAKPRIMEADFLAILKDLQVPMWHPATAFSVKALLSVGGWPEGMRLCEDYGLWCRFFLAGMIDLPAEASPVTMHRNRKERRPESERDAIRDRKVLALERILRREDPDPTPPRMKPFNWSQQPAPDKPVQATVATPEPEPAPTPVPAAVPEPAPAPPYDPTKVQSYEGAVQSIAMPDPAAADDMAARMVAAAQRGEDVIVRDGVLVSVEQARLEAQQAAPDPIMVTINGQSVPCADVLAAYRANPTEPDLSAFGIGSKKPAEKADKPKKKRQRNRNKSSTGTKES